ncbi:hypothetical protein DL769_002687 [Monosporascus sp. CRB-8-3]|nr:hypothetical protein DL769_002687 [Monosporascus sp. CRB-8-3]
MAPKPSTNRERESPLNLTPTGALHVDSATTLSQAVCEEPLKQSGGLPLGIREANLVGAELVVFCQERLIPPGLVAFEARNNSSGPLQGDWRFLWTLGGNKSERREKYLEHIPAEGGRMVVRQGDGMFEDVRKRLEDKRAGEPMRLVASLKGVTKESEEEHPAADDFIDDTSDIGESVEDIDEHSRESSRPPKKRKRTRRTSQAQD